jgi:quercetin dioxygenase-like cupin family protein
LNRIDFEFWNGAALFQHRELVCALRGACKPGAIRFDELMFPYVALTKDKAWQPGPYEGVELMILHKHESTGGVVVLRKFKAGHTIPAHTHPDANEWAYVLSGEWEESDTTYTSGALFFAPKGVRHGPHVAHTEVISLTIFDGPLTVA